MEDCGTMALHPLRNRKAVQPTPYVETASLNVGIGYRHNPSILGRCVFCYRLVMLDSVSDRNIS